jgi:O-antigen/teichoic acid export membrane protein
VLLRLTSHADLSPHAGVVIAAVVATRAPLLLPLNAFSTVILTRFVLQPERVRRRLLLLSVAVLAASAAGAVVGGLVGPWLLRLVYGPAFDIGAGVVAALVLAAGALAVQSISGAALLAQSRHRLFAGSWLLATLVALALLTLDVGVDARTCLALLVGPLAGVAVNVGSVLTHHRR